MRLATLLEDGRPVPAVVDAGRVLPLAVPGDDLRSVRDIAAGGADGLRRVRAWVAAQPAAAYRPLGAAVLGPAVPDPGAVYTIGRNYRAPGGPRGDGPDAGEPAPGARGPDASEADGGGSDAGARDRPLVYGKAPSSVTGHGALVTWDRSLTANVDAECELGVVIGATTRAVAPGDPMRHVFGYTVINDVSSRDPWLDGDQWLLGKSMAGFCPVGPWVVTADEIEPASLRLGCTLNGSPIQDDSTARMRFSVAEVVSYLSRHVLLRPGDLVATGTPARLTALPGPDRHLEVGDVVTTWIESIGELTITIA